MEGGQDLRVFSRPFSGASLRASAAGSARVLIVVGLLLLTAFAVSPTTQTIVVRWTDTLSRAYTHGALIVALSCFMLWRRRAALAQVDARFSWAGFAAALALGVAWLFAYRSGMQIVHQALLPLLWVAVVWTAFGFAMVRRAWLPLLFLYFTVPLWDVLVPLLQTISAGAVRGLLGLAGVPVFFDGLQLQIPAGRFEIAGGCSGLHFLIVALAIATFYGDLHDDNWRARAKLLALAAFFALLTNWLRILIIIVVGHLTDMQHHLVAKEHYSFGWMLFAVAMIIYFLIVRRWPASARRDDERPAPRAALAQSAPGITLAVVALALPALGLRLDDNIATAESAARHTLPLSVTGWQTTAVHAQAGEPKFTGADQQFQMGLESGGVALDAYVFAYLSQSQGKKLGGIDNRPLGGDLRANISVRSADGRWTEIGATDSSQHRWLVWIGYAIDSQQFADARSAQWVYGRKSLLGDPVSTVTVLRAPCRADCADERAAFTRFAAAARLGNVP